jgi:hypothetical protein
MKLLDVLYSMLHSRKFWAALLGVVGVILTEVNAKPETAHVISFAIVTLASFFIGGTAHEDAAEKKAQGMADKSGGAASPTQQVNVITETPPTQGVQS